jgi:hypothetical protein
LRRSVETTGLSGRWLLEAKRKFAVLVTLRCLTKNRSFKPPDQQDKRNVLYCQLTGGEQ